MQKIYDYPPFWMGIALLIILGLLLLFSPSCARQKALVGAEAGTGEYRDDEPYKYPANQNDGQNTATETGYKKSLKLPRPLVIYFDFDSYALDATAIESLIDWLDNPDAKKPYFIMIDGHCDERGTESYNLSLSEKRAAVVEDFIVHYGFDASKITTTGYGENRPVCLVANEDCWHKNRRVEVIAK